MEKEKRCGHAGCDAPLGLLHWSYDCGLCESTFCKEHLARPSYLEHLKNKHRALISIIDENKRICWKCCQSIGLENREWSKNLLSRECHHPSCGDDLSSAWVKETSCRMCGFWYCKKHTYDPTKLGNIADEFNYPMAKAVCASCVRALGRDRFVPLDDERWNEKTHSDASALVEELKNQASPAWKTAKPEVKEALEHGAGLLETLLDLMSEPTLSTKGKKLALCAIRYFVSPIDLLPDEIHGLRGYLDDVYISALVLEILLKDNGFEPFHAIAKDHDELAVMIRDTLDRCTRELEDTLVHRLNQEVHSGTDWDWPEEIPILKSTDSDAEKERAADRLDRYRQGYLEELFVPETETQDVWIFVAGFLSQGDDKVEWKESLIRLASSQNAKLLVYEWPSRETKEVVEKLSALATKVILRRLAKPKGGDVRAQIAMFLVEVGVTLYQFKDLWDQALSAADRNALLLAGTLQLEEFRGRTTIIGHSLGGRIVLKATEVVGQIEGTQVKRCLALAPAISRPDVDYQRLNQGAHETPEVYFTEKDGVLRVLFSAGEGEWGEALGLHGVPEESVSAVRSVDAEPVMDNGGHFKYPYHLDALLKHSKTTILSR